MHDEIPVAEFDKLSRPKEATGQEISTESFGRLQGVPRGRFACANCGTELEAKDVTCGCGWKWKKTKSVMYHKDRHRVTIMVPL